MTDAVQANRTAKARKMAAAERLTRELAILGTLAIHCIFFYGFKVQSSSAHQPAAETDEPDCVLVAPFEELSPNAPSHAWQREIHAWCILGDPTVMSLPNDAWGFSSVRGNERELPYREPPPFECRVALAPERPQPDVKLAETLPQVATEVSEKWRLPPPRVADVPKQVSLPRGTILWRRTDGMLLQHVPPMDEQAVKTVLAQGPPLTGPTRLQVDRRVPFVRYQVRNSCGNAELDQLAVSTLRRAAFAVELQNADPAALGIGDVVPQPDGDCVFEIEWRLLRPPDGTDGEEAP